MPPNDLDAYDFDLPKHRIAQQPPTRRDRSRALVATRRHFDVTEIAFGDITAEFVGDECLVVNDTRVIPARVSARRESGGEIEVFLLRAEGEGIWHSWLSPSKRLRAGEKLRVDDGEVEVIERCDQFWRVRFGSLDRLEAIGEVPLPPYIHREIGDARLTSTDRERYQTIFARSPGAVAAPTAGLHFTEELTAKLSAQGIPILPVTLHVGPGTFKPIQASRLDDHRVDAELFEVSEQTRNGLALARADGRRIIAVGTTSARVLETLALRGDRFEAGPEITSETDLTILPGHHFGAVDGLITNYHLPRSSLLVLVATFHGLRATMHAYQEAIRREFRFYSYGDAMVILPDRDRAPVAQASPRGASR